MNNLQKNEMNYLRILVEYGNKKSFKGSKMIEGLAEAGLVNISYLNAQFISVTPTEDCKEFIQVLDL